MAQRSIAVAITGVGLVGSEFINQLLSFSLPSTPNSRYNPFKIISLSSSGHTLFSPNGLEVTSTSWRDSLTQAPPKDPKDLISELSKLASGSSYNGVVFVDNTSSDSIASLYPLILSQNIHVITPNKKAFSSTSALYESIKAASLTSGAKYLNESTVGAGLPVVATLKDLVNTGDKVKKVEGVFSGTFSYIFNEFSKPGETEGGEKFSEVVKKAKALGYTEPHPADDLTGSDVARKLTILSRIIPSSQPLPEGYLSVSTTSLVPDPLLKSDANEFMSRLPEYDSKFDELRDEARKNGEVVRYVGVIDLEKGSVKADMVKYPKDHPFATSLGGSDNIIMFHTERYGKRPLIVQGAGAGAAVTAMGVMSDLLKLL
ncbi:aspartate kinase homoserine dehydrogenase [Abortiporus biennis]|nr:aspartate kinase homoserine dehydrogenase [Abortiporus biennis]